MCKRRHNRSDVFSPAMQAYEGDTVRLAEQQAAMTPTDRRRHCGSFPWWMLWLIWPAIGLLRMIIERVAEVIGAVGNPLIIGQVIGAVVLIVVGIALLVWENGKDTTWRR